MIDLSLLLVHVYIFDIYIYIKYNYATHRRLPLGTHIGRSGLDNHRWNVRTPKYVGPTRIESQVVPKCSQTEPNKNRALQELKETIFPELNIDPSEIKK